MILKIKATIATIDALPDQYVLITMHGVETSELLAAVGESLKQGAAQNPKMSVSAWMQEDFKTT